LRAETFARQKEMGIIPKNTKLAPKSEDIKDWDQLTPNEQKLFALQMETFAGFMGHTDNEIGRLVTSIDGIDELDNTLFIYIMGDNGSSAEGALVGTYNELIVLNGLYGKWHLGRTEGRFPTDQGFDEWYGVPNSTDESVYSSLEGFSQSGVPETFVMDSKKLEVPQKVRPYRLDYRPLIDRDLTDRAIRFMKKNTDAKKPFFLYLPYTATHFPTMPHPDFRGKSGKGLWGDVLMQIDSYLGELLDTIDVSDFLLGKTEKSGREGFIVYMGNDIFGVKWRDWNMHFKEQTGWNGVLREYTMPRVYNLINDPYERDNVLFPHTWVLKAGLPQLEEHVLSLKKYPTIPTGAPDPYKPPY